MKVRQIMTENVICLAPDSSVETAARWLTHYNIGILPVCSADGKLRGLVTDRDLVTRCVAASLLPAKTAVREVMTRQITTVSPDMDTAVAAHLMGRCQVRRLPVVENGKLCGIVGLGDLAVCEDSVMDAADALADITANMSTR